MCNVSYKKYKTDLILLAGKVYMQMILDKRTHSIIRLTRRVKMKKEMPSNSNLFTHISTLSVLWVFNEFFCWHRLDDRRLISCQRSQINWITIESCFDSIKLSSLELIRVYYEQYVQATINDLIIEKISQKVEWNEWDKLRLSIDISL